MSCNRREPCPERGHKAGREGFEPSRELYTPYPLSRRVLSATQPPPRRIGLAFDSIGRGSSPYLWPNGSTRRAWRASDVGARTQDGIWSGARFEEQGLVHARRREPERGLLSLSRSGR